ncbi:MAG: DEAD/DEAH box helicase [candidate division Zixibacteria bacterium]|nr:DEAD/DEAH box helicase [candidate division Zixibacteria bacterium]
MKISHLASFGIPEVIVNCWREKLGSSLLPVQEKAVKEANILEGASLMISAPTSSGKTFCGELAAAATIFKRKKAIFLVPLKSIAEEKYFDFTARYSALGIKVVISTRDRKEFDLDLERGDFHLAILVYEKFNQLLIKNIDLLSSVDLILIDEVQIIGDRSRGASLELALLKVLVSDYSPQIVALSAVLKEPEKLANWLGCELLEDHYRPVELRQGVLTAKRFRYRTFNSQSEGQESLSDVAADEPEELLLVNIEHLVAKGEQLLVFLKSKRSCEQLAATLAERNFWPTAAATSDRLQVEVVSSLGEKLLAMLQSGVAFHHADLSYQQRKTLEDGFRQGEIKALISTTTLAMGVNLPAQTVFIDCYKYQVGEYSGKPMVVPLAWSEYEGMSGRAGRLGSNGEFGRSILIATSTLEEETIWDMYVNGTPDSIESQLGSRLSVDVVLDLVASRTATQSDQLTGLLTRSLYARQKGGFDEEEIAQALCRLEKMKLVFRRENNLEPSPLGGLISLRGIGVDSGMAIVAQLKRFGGVDKLSWLYTALSLPDSGATQIFVNHAEDSVGVYRQQLSRYVHDNGEVSPQLQRLTDEDYLVTDDQKNRLKAALLLLDWTGRLPTVEIESRYHVNIGAILQVAETTAWLLEGAAAIAQLLNSSAALVGFLRRLSIAVGCGYDPQGTRLGFKAEQRDLALALQQKGIVAANQLTDENRAAIAGVVGTERADLLIKKFSKTNNKKQAEAKEASKMPQLKLWGCERGNRVVINYNNTEIDITPKSFNYLFKLTAARLLSIDGWLSKEEIEPGFNQAKNIYRIKQELKRYATGLERCIENNKAGRYRINLQPAQIRIDYESMDSFADRELAELARRLQEKRVVERDFPVVEVEKALADGR